MSDETKQALYEYMGLIQFQNASYAGDLAHLNSQTETPVKAWVITKGTNDEEETESMM